MLTDKEKLEKILNLLTDKTHGKLCAAGDKYFENDDERFGVMVFITYLFNKAYKIARGN